MAQLPAFRMLNPSDSASAVVDRLNRVRDQGIAPHIGCSPNVDVNHDPADHGSYLALGFSRQNSWKLKRSVIFS